MDIYIGRKKKPGFNLVLGEEVVLQLTKDLERSFCSACFDSFFNSPKLIEKLFQKGIYGIGTIRSNRKQMPKMIYDKQMKRGDCEILFSGNTMSFKWMDTWSVLLLSTSLEGMIDILSFQRGEKGSKTKLSVPYLKVVSSKIAEWVELTLQARVPSHIVWIESHLLAFSSPFLLIWGISHVSIVTSFIT